MSRVVKLETLADDQLKTRVRVLRYDIDHGGDPASRDKAKSDLRMIEAIIAKRAAAKKPPGGLRGWVTSRLAAGETPQQ